MYLEASVPSRSRKLTFIDLAGTSTVSAPPAGKASKAAAKSDLDLHPVGQSNGLRRRFAVDHGRQHSHRAQQADDVVEDDRRPLSVSRDDRDNALLARCEILGISKKQLR